MEKLNTLISTSTVGNYSRYLAIMTVLLLTWTCLELLGYFTQVCYGTIVIASAPVNPVREDDVLSLQCEVREIQTGEKVEIMRTTIEGGRKELLYDADFVKSDRFFVAEQRRNEGGTTTVSYLLTITGVTREDDGIYLCKVLRKDGDAVELERAFNSVIMSAMDSVHIGVVYFPGRSEPKCSINDISRAPLLTGTEVRMNCSSAMSNPSVSFQWFRAGNETNRALPIPHPGVIDLTTNRLYFDFTYTLQDSDDGVVFICQISSPMFSGQSQSCHIGPYKVIPAAAHGPSNDVPPPSGDVHNLRRVPPLLILPTTATTPTVEGVSSTGNDAIISEYGVTCLLVNSPLLSWVIATVLAGTLLGIFLIVTVILIFKVRTLQRPRASKDWNTLPESIINSTSPDSFKNQVTIHLRPQQLRD